jgi:hypothetical protein
VSCVVHHKIFFENQNHCLLPMNLLTTSIQQESLQHLLVQQVSYISYNGALSCLNKHSCIGSSMLHPVSQSVPSSFAALAWIRLCTSTTKTLESHTIQPTFQIRKSLMMVWFTFPMASRAKGSTCLVRKSSLPTESTPMNAFTPCQMVLVHIWKRIEQGLYYISNAEMDEVGTSWNQPQCKFGCSFSYEFHIYIACGIMLYCTESAAKFGEFMNISIVLSTM